MSRTLARRTFLRGLGTALSLPLLEGMGPALRPAAAAAASPTAGAAPLRMAFIFFPNGAIMRDWTPQETGGQFDLPATLAPLEPYRRKLAVLSGLAQDNGRSKGDGPGDHARSAATFLTGAHPVKTSGANIRVGVSVDQVAAEQVGHLTRLPSLELGTERGRQAGSCDSGYSCAYSSTISWKTASTPMAKEIDPRLVFERLFGSKDSAAQQAGQQQRAATRQSILDLVADDASRLRQQLGQTDRRKLDEYLSSVRELERRLGPVPAAASTAGLKPSDLKQPDGIPNDTREHLRLMYDLLLLAFRTDSTRIATFMLANEGSNRSYRQVGVSEGHHQLSHHRNDEEKMVRIQKIDRFLLEEFARFVGQLEATAEGDGTLLDRSMIVYGGSLSDGNRHQHNNLPIVLAGGGGGTLRTGVHLRLEQETPLNNLFLSLLDRMGAKADSLGDSTGRLSVIDRA